MTDQIRLNPLPARLIEKHNLNLSGLTVYTEAASGAYLLTPILAALAGAEHVFAQTQDSQFADAGEVIARTREMAAIYDVQDSLEFLDRRCHRSLAVSDIVTNSGLVRPIDKDLIDTLKPTAVIPLMWETWELRPSEFDLGLCKDRDILVLGTNEQSPSCDMSRYAGLLALKLLFDLGFDGGKILVLGSDPLPAGPMVDYMRRIDIDVTWASAGGNGDLDYESLGEHYDVNGSEYDVMIIAEHKSSQLLLGKGGLIEFDSIHKFNPMQKIGVICGNVCEFGLRKSGLQFCPQTIAPVGHLSYQPYLMGPRPVLDLYAAGLKVGETMARARLAGLSVRESATEALNNSPAMDFEEGMAWV